MEQLGEFVVNHWMLVLAFIVLAALLLSDLLRSKMSGATAIGVAEATQLINRQKGLFLDIRGTSEFERGYIADSKNIPLSGLNEQLDTIKDLAQPIILVCASGQRAATAGKLMRSHGFSDVYVLKGGVNTWKEAKLPLFTKKA